MHKIKIGVIGGSGIYNIDGLENQKRHRVESPWGIPSDEILTGTLKGIEIAFLPRHGRNHTLSPTSIPYRANIDEDNIEKACDCDDSSRVCTNLVNLIVASVEQDAKLSGSVMHC